MFHRGSQKYVLTEEQRRMYASEKLVNFRWISKVLAKRSSSILSEADLVTSALNAELAELGQFAELAYSAVSVEFICQNLGTLAERSFPLEGYDALQGFILVSSFKGEVARLPGYVAYRPSTKQLIAAISGTSSFSMVFHDLRALKRRHPSGRGKVHSGFWTLYNGVKASILSGLIKGLERYDVKELCITGHSMGGSVAYLLCLDLLAANGDHALQLPFDLRVKLAVFGVPRTGDFKLVKYWQELIDERQKVNGPQSFKEYSVKGFNDGVPALPPSGFGYRHFAQKPMYLARGRLYQIPDNESEHTLFEVSLQIISDSTSGLDFPRGGHNYYNGRDLERFARRIAWLARAKPEESGWEDRYRTSVRKHTSS